MTPERFAKLKEILNRRQPDLTVLMDEIHKPQNIAALKRTCDAVGASRLHGVSADRHIRRHHGIAGGTRRWVETVVHSDMPGAVTELKSQGMTLYAAHWSDRAIDFREADFTVPSAILLGAERVGVSSMAAELADVHITLPMLGMVASLNVSVAGAVILYEAMQQRERAGLYAHSRMEEQEYRKTLFEWCHPEIAQRCRDKRLPYPELTEDGDLAENPFE